LPRGYGDAEFKDALSTLRTVPDSSGANAHDWLRTAAEVRGRLLGGDWKSPAKAESANLGIPTWLYGFEPPNMFATVIGKYFYNSVREDGLVTIASGGLIFGKGEAGTVQEETPIPWGGYKVKAKVTAEIADGETPLRGVVRTI
jgi:hypothetical protein